MTFLNPPMLVGLAAALVPLALHLLNRSRYRNVDWAAMMFLVGLDAATLQSTRLKQWLLLVLRSAIVVLLAVALARPVLYPHDLPPNRAGRTAAVLLLDRSASMAVIDNGRPRLDLAREAIFQLLSPGFHRGDDLWLLTMGEPATVALPPPPAYAADPQEMARRVKEVAPPAGVADVAAGLRRALEILAGAEAPNREIYVVCDRQAGSWDGVNAAFAAEWARRVAGERPPRLPPRVFVVPVGTEETDNVAIQAVGLTREPLVAGQPTTVDVKIHNYGSVPRAAVPLDVSVLTPGGGGRPPPPAWSRPVNLAAASVTTVAVPITFNVPGSNIVTAKIGAGGAAAAAAGNVTDRDRSVSVEVLRDLRVLVIDGDEREASLQSGGDFLRLALTPYAQANVKRNTAAVTVLRPDAWGQADLRNCNVLVLSNVPSFTEAQAEAIRQFVYDGGGLLVAPGDQVRAESYNASLPWLGAALQPAIAESESSSTALGWLELDHPVFRFLQGRADSAPPAVRRYFPATPRQGMAVLGSYTDGKPFLLERAAGRGRILLLTTPIDTDWNSLPLTHFFLPFVQSAVRYAASGEVARREAERNLAPGRTLVAEFGEPLESARVAVTVPLKDQPVSRVGGGGPGGAAIVVSQFGATGAQVRCDNTAAPGVYRILPHGANDTAVVQFAVSTPQSESDLSPLSRERWAEIERDLMARRLEPERGPLATGQEAARSGSELWLPLMGVVMALCIVELSVTRRWAGGDA